MAPPFSVYVAGALFTHKDLTGNALLASYIAQCSLGRYVCVLPQNLEQSTQRAVDIRNHDLRHLMRCDLALFNFDGAELDSGTVAEFMFAKFLDIPSVILRSDFRAAGDQEQGGNAWNLMCSFYPRTQTVQCHAMHWYHQAQREGGTLEDVTARYYTRIATTVIENLDAVCHESPLSKGTPADVERLYHWALRFPGGGFAESCGESAFIDTLIAEKRHKGLL